MNDDLRVLKAADDDAPVIHQLIATVLGAYQLYHLRPNNVDDDIDTMSANYFNDRGYFWVVKRAKGTILASVAIYKINEATCELRKMYLLPQEQGKGIGKLLLQTAIEKAKELGYKEMKLKTNSKLNIAIAMYKKNGFEFEIISDEDKKQDCDVAMKLELI